MRQSIKENTYSLKTARPLTRDFFARDPRVVAQELLGKVLVRRNGRKLLAGRIVETEAYLGADDAAAHAAAGRTPRNAVLFGPPGHAYVYFIYGNHYCLNFSCEPEGQAGCVLIRALEPLAGEDEMAARRDVVLDSARKRRLLTSGPGRLAEAMGITRERDNGKDVVERSDLQVLVDGYVPRQVEATTRIGITKAAHQPLRFFITGNEFVSGNRRAVSTASKMANDATQDRT